MSWLTPILRDERVMLTTLGAMAVGTVYLIHTLLEVYRDESEVKPVQPKTQYITQETEDSLKYSTLDSLLGHYNYNIRDVAGKIVCDRALNDPAVVDTLLYGITRPDYDERIKNLRALAVITDFPSLHYLHRWKVYAALVRSLELGLEPDRSKQEKLNDRHHDDYYLRDMAEKLCLMFVSQLLGHYSPRKLIKARFVEKWLAKQYWGDSPGEIVSNFQQYMVCRQNRITDITTQIVQHPSGREALFRAGLISEVSKKMMEDGGDEDSDDQADRPVGGRPQDQSAEEQRLRHRHREAMVFNDGSRPFNSEDIIQRDHGSS